MERPYLQMGIEELSRLVDENVSAKHVLRLVQYSAVRAKQLAKRVQILFARISSKTGQEDGGLKSTADPISVAG